MVSAEIPDPQLQPNLYHAVTTHMLHGPCHPDKCLKNGTCTKNYPKKFAEETSVVDGAYPTYRQRNNGRTVSRRNFVFDNRWVVPYNPYLITKYNCHINVEICGSIQAVKYLYKYIYKGHDKAMVEIGLRNSIDEIKEYLDCRFVAASESCWRFFSFKLHVFSHSVLRLQCHLKGQQYTTFRENQPILSAMENAKKTMLTEFFTFCNDDHHARQFTYLEIN